MVTKRSLVAPSAVAILIAGIALGIVCTGRQHESQAPLAIGSGTPVDIRATATPGIGFRPLIVDVDTLRFQAFSREWNYGTVRPFSDGSVLITNGDPPHWFMVAPDGTVPAIALPIPGRAEVGFSADETRFAWADFDGIRVFDRRDGSVRTVDPAAWVGGAPVWSPDATQIAITRVTGDNVAHLDVLNLATSTRREVFAARATKAIRGVRWLSPHVIEFRALEDADLAQCCPPQGGTRYEVSDEGEDLNVTGVPNVLWADCGPACGLPPEGYERLDGTVYWHEPVSGGTIYHWGFVDRAANIVRVLPQAEDSGAYARSSDGSSIAFITCNFRDPMTLRIVRLTDLTVRDFVPPPIAGDARVCYNVSWFPSGKQVLLHFGKAE